MTESRRDFLKIAAAASIPMSLGLPITSNAALVPQSCSGTGNLVKRFFNQTVTTLSPCTGTSCTGTNLPASAFMVPGNYSFNGQVYDCSQSGLYCFWRGNDTAIEARIVHNTNLYDLFSGIAWHHAHGIDDEYLWSAFSNNLQALSNAGMQHKWRLSCGSIVDLVCWWLQLSPPWGYTIPNTLRRIQLLSNSTPNCVDDGHTVLEVKVNGTWRLWDLTNHCYFTYNGNHLSAGDIISHGVLNCGRVPLDDAGKIKVTAGTTTVSNGPWCYSTYYDMTLYAQAEKDAWFARIYHTAYILTPQGLQTYGP